jgi:hypothetical protein
MKKIDSRGLPDAVLNERRLRAVKLREAGVAVHNWLKGFSPCDAATTNRTR